MRRLSNACVNIILPERHSISWYYEIVCALVGQSLPRELATHSGKMYQVKSCWRPLSTPMRCSNVRMFTIPSISMCTDIRARQISELLMMDFINATYRYTTEHTPTHTQAASHHFAIIFIISHHQPVAISHFIQHSASRYARSFAHIESVGDCAFHGICS